MEKIEIAKRLFNAIEVGLFEQAVGYLTPDFTFSGAVDKPINSKEYLDVHQKLLQGFPDFKFNLSNLSESGNTVNATAQVEGTHSRNLPSIMPGVESKMATNTHVKNPKENVVFTFKGDKIKKITVEKVPNGGIAGFLQKIGVEVPVR